jgi:hypothetical protein
MLFSSLFPKAGKFDWMKGKINSLVLQFYLFLDVNSWFKMIQDRVKDYQITWKIPFI